MRRTTNALTPLRNHNPTEKSPDCLPTRTPETRALNERQCVSRWSQKRLQSSALLVTVWYAVYIHNAGTFKPRYCQRCARSVRFVGPGSRAGGSRGETRQLHLEVHLPIAVFVQFDWTCPMLA
jgi:hypothetical protein